jgi:5'-nucleotidase
MISDKTISRILLTNDDGFDAPGMLALADVAQGFSRDIWTVAPFQDQSGMGQSVSLTAPLRCTARNEKQWIVSGSPADCVLLANSYLMRESPPALILSGINAGANTGDDVNLSGTVGAAFMSLQLGVPAIAISLDCQSRKNARWDTARAVMPRVLRYILATGWDHGMCLSINIPDLPADKVTGLAWTRPARRTTTSFNVVKREDLRENDYYWFYPNKTNPDHGADTDLAALARGYVSITVLKLDRSLAPVLEPVSFDALPAGNV